MSAASANGFVWTDSVAAKAQQLWREGLSAAAIATRIGTTRSAVCGYATRNRDRFPSRLATVAPRKAKPRQARLARPPVEKLTVRQVSSLGRVPWAAPVAQAGRPIASVRDLSRFRLPGEEPIAFMDLGHAQCRFPLEAFETRSGHMTPCCGAATGEGASYCAAHLRLMARDRS